MQFAILAVEIAALVAMVLVHRHQLRGLSSFFEDRLKAQDEAETGRQLALYKQQKAAAQTVARSDSAVRKMVDQTRALQEESTRTLKRVDRFVTEQKKETGRG